MNFKDPPFIKSESDKRDYRILFLENKMKVILVSDMEADKSAVAMNVHVGGALDPLPLYGLAHFLEHMLFQGTERYPDVNEFDSFVSENGGYNNAFTTMLETNYYFNISNEALAGGLDRLASFFICPNFSESSVNKEINAIDSEFKKNI
jgi:insulysin